MKYGLLEALKLKQTMHVAIKYLATGILIRF